jgi:hypothetical protein
VKLELAGRELKLAVGVEASETLVSHKLLFFSRRGLLESDVSLEQSQFFFGLNVLQNKNNYSVPLNNKM